MRNTNMILSLRHGLRRATRCGEPGRGSDSPPGCHSLPRLRFAYPRQREVLAVAIRKINSNLAYKSVYLLFSEILIQ